jgi:flagellar protein FliJ
MSALDSLIRVNRWRLDEQRRQLAELDRLAEQKVAAASLEAGYAYPGFARELGDRQRKLAASLAEVESQIVAAREGLAEIFGEMKRYEIAQANREKRERQVVAKKQGAAQDELALQMFRRRGAAR